MATALILAFAAAAGVAGAIILTAHLHGSLSHDSHAGPQKFHHHPTPRIGGLAVLAGLLGAALFMRDAFQLMLLACAAPAFVGGLADYLTKRIRGRVRLSLTLGSATLAFFLLDARVTHVAVPGLDWALQLGWFSFLFTLLVVAGFANSVNIVDGFNGLAGVVALIIALAIGYVAFQVGDRAILASCALLAAALAGFLVWNYPRGLVFLGDGGAYLVGFLIAELGVLLVFRNDQVSPWFLAALFAYPITEVLFSIYRKLARRQSPGHPDGLHLHMLIHKRLVRPARADAPSFWANALTSPYLWLLTLVGALPAVLFWRHTGVLQICGFAFIGFYIWLYVRIVRFRVPRSFAIFTMEENDNALR
jgi:UDP-GlcNAc:undecaprenyl-phosphate GlcNAc-1-phosphate transferase